jgi:DNA-binding MarR family transcriptional regulator
MTNGNTAKKPTAVLQTGLLHDAFGHLFRRCHLRSQQAFARAFEGSDLSPLQYGIMELVLLNPGITHGELAEGMVTAPSVVTTAMKPLRRIGFLVPQSSSEDARRCGYTLSAAGEAYFAALRGQILAAEDLLVGALNESERRTLMRLLRRVAAGAKLQA